ncbi:MAG: alpha/beta hydrolase [Caldilineaceae bacterium]
MSLFALPYVPGIETFRYGDDPRSLRVAFAHRLCLIRNKTSSGGDSVLAVGVLRSIGSMWGTQAACQEAGLAVWSIEYRRVGNGGEWPNLLSDVARAYDTLALAAERFPLDLQRVIVCGHSAGGHLALWLAARPRLPAEWRTPQAIPVRGVLALAPVVDLAASIAENICTGNAMNLVGGSAQEYADRYQIASPFHQLPIGVRQIILYGAHDDIVPPSHAAAYIAKAYTCGEDLRFHVLPSAGHFELVTAGSSVWDEVRDSLFSLLWVRDYR